MTKGKIKIDPEKAAIVRMIFEDYISGMGGDKIARKLREINIPSVFGGTWCSERVLDIIKNEKYTGNALLQKKFVVDHLTKKAIRNKGQLKQYFAEGTHTAIIDKATFKKANEILEHRRLAFNISSKEQKRYPFTGIIRCGNCGKNFKRKASKGKYSWICSTYQRQGKTACPSKQIPEPTLIKLAAEVLGIYEFDEALFSEIITEIRVPEANRLEFIFTDGLIVERTWLNPSRAESWTDKMREVARQKSIERSREMWQKQKR